MTKVLVACLQLNSNNDEERNWQQIQDLAHRAANYNAKVLALPENALYEGHPLKRSQDIEGLWKPRFQQLAKDLNVSLVCGSLREPIPDSDLTYNTSLAINNDGTEVGRYRKIHLFDIDLPDGPNHQESSYLAPGQTPVACNLDPLGQVGLSICYDLRFPELYRHLVQKEKVQTLFVPSSFTLMTGRDHWLPLLKARAIENQCFVIAPNQWNAKSKLPRYGRSVIIDPWGTTLAQAADGPGLCLAELDFSKQKTIRTGLPALDHTRLS